jgi:hypothetical protein
MPMRTIVLSATFAALAARPSNRLSGQEPGGQVCQGVRPQVRGSFAGDSAILEGCRRGMAFQDEVASRRSYVESEATSNRCVIWRLQQLPNASELRRGYLPRHREPQ